MTTTYDLSSAVDSILDFFWIIYRFLTFHNYNIHGHVFNTLDIVYCSLCMCLVVWVIRKVIYE